MRRRASRRLTKILVLLSLVVCAACASFRGKELPERDLREFTESERLPAVTYELSNTSATTGSLQGGWSDQSVDRVFNRGFSEAQRKESAEGLHLEVAYMSRTRQPVFTLGLGLLTIASIGLIPTYGRDDLNLFVRVEVDGELVRRYEYEDHVSLWIHLFMIPWAYSHDPGEIEQAVLENMLLNFLHDFRRDLPGFPKPAAG